MRRVDALVQHQLQVHVADGHPDSLRACNDDPHSWDFVNQFDDVLNQAAPYYWNHGNAEASSFEPVIEPCSHEESSVSFQDEHEPPSLSPPSSDEHVDSPPSSQHLTDPSMHPAHPTQYTSFTEMGAWTEHEHLSNSKNTRNIPKQVKFAHQPKQQRPAEPVSDFNNSQQDGSVALSREASQSKPYSGQDWIGCDGTELSHIRAPLVDMNTTGERWMDDFKDDFGATGTRTVNQSMPSMDNTPGFAGSWPSSQGNNTQVLSDAFGQPHSFDWANTDPFALEIPTNFSEVDAIMGQALLSMQDPLYDLPTGLYDTPSTFAPGNEAFATYNPTFDFENSSGKNLIPSPNNALTLARANVSTFNPQNMNQATMQTVLRPSTNANHQSRLRIILDDGLGDLRTEMGLKKVPNGRRGPLPKDKAARVAKTRKERTVCLTCRMMKVAVGFRLFYSMNKSSRRVVHWWFR